MAWIRQVLAEVYPNGVLRRALLDHFALLLVSKRSSKGAKGRLARRLYGSLLKLQRRGLVALDEGVVRASATPPRTPEAPLEMSPTLGRLLFKALLAEDGQGDGHTPETLRLARWNFLAGAIESGLTLAQAASTMGIQVTQARALLEKK